LYYIFVTIYSIGYGDIRPINIIEKIFVIILMFFGSMLYSLAISYLSMIFSQNNTIYLEYRKKQSILEEINSDYELPSDLYVKLNKLIKHEFKNNESDRYNLLEILPKPLKNELMISIYSKKFKNYKFFFNKTNDFILQVLPFLKLHSVSKGDILFSVGDSLDEMYFVKSGTLNINIGFQFHSIALSRISKHQHFGNVFIDYNQPSPFELK